MRFSAAGLFLLAACASTPDRPPYLDTIGGKPLPTGTVSGGDASTPPGDGGTITVLASGLSTPRGIAASGLFVYVTVPSGANGTPGILAIPKVGGAPQVLVSNVDPPNAIAASSSTACFATDTGGVFCTPLQGGAVTTLATGELGVSSIVLANELAYWPSAQGGLVVERSSVGGTGRTVLTTAGGPFTPAGITAASASIFVTVSGSGANVYETPNTGGVAEPLATPAIGAWVDAIFDTSRVIVGHQLDGASEILAVSTTGGAIKALAQSLPSVGHLARDAGHVYWTSPSDGSIYALALTVDAVPSILATGLASPYAIAVDDEVYVTTLDGVVRLPRAL